jgi:hypothetical protein
VAAGSAREFLDAEDGDVATDSADDDVSTMAAPQAESDEDTAAAELAPLDRMALPAEPVVADEGAALPDEAALRAHLADRPEAVGLVGLDVVTASDVAAAFTVALRDADPLPDRRHHHRLRPRGLTAALYAARADLAPLHDRGREAGGQLMLTTEVENFPGFPDGIMGPALMADMRKQAERFGTEFVTADVDEVDFSGSPFTVRVGDDTYAAHSIIISTGATARWLGLPTSSGSSAGRVELRDLRRVLLPRPRARRRRRRRLRDGGGDVPHEVRLQGHRRAPPRRAARLEDHAGPGLGERQDRLRLERVVVDVLGDEVVEGVVRATHPARPAGAGPPTGCSSRSATTRPPRCSPASSTSTRTATSSSTSPAPRRASRGLRRRRRRRPIYRQASPPRDGAARPRSTPSAGWPLRAIDAHNWLVRWQPPDERAVQTSAGCIVTTDAGRGSAVRLSPRHPNRGEGRFGAPRFSFRLDAVAARDGDVPRGCALNRGHPCTRYRPIQPRRNPMSNAQPVTDQEWDARCCVRTPCPRGLLGGVVRALPDGQPPRRRDRRREAGSLKVLKLNVDENPDTARKYQVMSIPTLMLFKDKGAEAEAHRRRQCSGARGTVKPLASRKPSGSTHDAGSGPARTP